MDGHLRTIVPRPILTSRTTLEPRFEPWLMDRDTLFGHIIHNSWLLSLHRRRHEDRRRPSLSIQQSRPSLRSLNKRAHLARSSKHLDSREFRAYSDWRLPSEH